MEPRILWFDQIGIKDLALVGGKNASLGEMIRRLKKIPIPPGFAITSSAYRYTLQNFGAENYIKEILKDFDLKNLAKIGKEIRGLIEKCPIPADLEAEILMAYRRLGSSDVAVRSSATAEDLPSASFAGQQASFLNVKGEKELLAACKKCFASLYTDRAIAYRHNQKIDHLKTYLSIGVQQMIRSDLGSAGVLFTIDTETGFPNVVVINGSWGLGESVVLGLVNPDEFILFKPNLSVIGKTLGEKGSQIVYTQKGTKAIKTPLRLQNRFCLSEKETVQLAKWALEIEKHYKMPMDIEWAKDGKNKKLYILQARPETVQSKKNRDVLEEYRLERKGKILTVGKSVGTKIAVGKAHVIHSVKEIAKFKKGEVLVTEMTDPDWVPIMKMAAAIVTNRGGRTSHAAIVSRELGLPCIVGTNDATRVIKNGEFVTVSCAGSSEQGTVYQGALKFTIKKTNIKKAPQTKTKIMINIGYPEEAFETSFLPNDGVGLARQEFIIGEQVRIHPMALIHPEKVDASTRKVIQKMIQNFESGKDFFIEKLSRGVAKIAAGFYPKDVILRFSDFKSNEYMNLIGGKFFEPKEANPMIGLRGASRYYSPAYEEAFALECAAIRKVRDEFGLKNLKVMVPVCRTVEEGKKVLHILEKNGLKQGKEGLEVYVMCEIPSNVILADQFADLFDGFSIGSNDLTQMVLGVDRDSELVADIYDERNEAVLRMIRSVIEIAHKKKRKIGICGDAPSTYPEFAKFLVDCGIDSISLSPDSVMKTKLFIAKHEKGKSRPKKGGFQKKRKDFG